MTKYILHPPFIITARLCIGLRIGDATLSLLGTEAQGVRLSCSFALDTPTFEYLDDRMSMGGGGIVDMFETFLGFLSAAVESRQYRERAGKALGKDDDSNEHLFPPHVIDWAIQNYGEIEGAQCDISNPEDGSPNNSLIEEK